MTELSRSAVTRWAAGDGGLSAGSATMTEQQALEAMPQVGLYEVDLGGDAYEVERVGARYCSVDDVRAWGEQNNDSFADPSRCDDDAVLAAIQAAEEAIEEACRRSFCGRAIDVDLKGGGVLTELPVQDARSISAGELVGDRQAVSAEACTARLVYGARCTASLRRATVKLAASYLRPRAGAENARGQSVDGVYVSLELATGGEGSWTGIPDVDAVIERIRSRRAVVA